MNKSNITIKKVLVFVLLLASFSSCKKESIEKTESVKLNLKSFANDGNNSYPSLTEIDMFIFTNGILSKIYLDNALDSDGGLAISLDEVGENKVYFLADPNEMTNYTSLKEGESLESDFIEAKTKEINIASGEVSSEFYVGYKDFADAGGSNIDIKRGVARVDIHINPSHKLEIMSIKLKNLNTSSYIYDKSDVNTFNFNTMDYEKVFETPLTSNMESFCLLLEQKTDNSHLEITATIDGIKTIIRGKLPSMIKRNNIYDLKIKGIGTSLEATVTGREWEDGGNIDADSNAPIVSIDVESSDFPSFVRISPSLDTIFVMSTNDNYNLVLSSKEELDIELEGDLLIEASPYNSETQTTLYKITSQTMVTRNVTSLKIKYKSQEHFSGDRIVFVPESQIKYTGPITKYFKNGGNVDFNKYIDGIIGTLEMPSTSVINEGTVPEWIKLETEEIESTNSKLVSITGGFRPNNMIQNGDVQEYSFTVTHTSGIVEPFNIRRISNSLPVVNINDQYWCMYNLRGNSRKFEDQILTIKDNLFEYLQTCSDEEFAELAGDGYRGTDPVGTNLKAYETPSSTEGEEPTYKFSFEGYAPSNSIGYTGSVEACPDGYMIPESEDFNNIIKYFKGGVGPLSWDNPQGIPMELSWFIRRNLKVDNVNFANNVNIYYVKSKKDDTAENPNTKLALYGFGYQEAVMDFKYFQALFTMGSTGLFWGVFNNATSFDSQGGHRPTPATIRYIRCVKKPDFFIY